MAAKEDNTAGNEEDNEDDNENKKDKRKDEINEMNEPEYDDDQVDPYHGKQPELPEPEPMDLPEDLQLDDGNEKDEANEENPFDIDKMKEDMPPPEEKPTETDLPETTNDEDGDESHSESEDETKQENSDEINENKEDDGEEQEDKSDLNNTEIDKKQDPHEDKMEDKEEEPKEDIQSGLDQLQTQDKQAEAMDVNDIECADNVQTQPQNQTNSSQVNEDVSQEENPDKDGVGQSQMEESKTGHKGQANAQQESHDSNKQEELKEKRKRPGESDIQRSLGDISEPIKKKLKAMNVEDSQQQEDDNDGISQEKEADVYQHIKESKSSDEQVRMTFAIVTKYIICFIADFRHGYKRASRNAEGHHKINRR